MLYTLVVPVCTNTATLLGPNTLVAFKALAMFAANTDVEADQLISPVVSVPSASLNVPVWVLGLNVSRCTSLDGTRELGEAVTTAVTSPAVFAASCETGAFCN